MNDSNIKLSVVGISHITSSVEDRELLQLSRKELPRCLAALKAFDGIEGVLVLVTCNRIEFYFTAQPGTSTPNLVHLYYKNIKSIDTSPIDDKFYYYEDEKVTRHLFSVISGLESLVIGEYQIQSQVREAYSIACEHKSVEKILHKLLHAAFRTGKRVRSQTGIGSGRLSVSGVASQIIIDSTGIDDTIAIVGVNENTKIMASSLQNSGFRKFIFLNRTAYKAEMLVKDFGGEACDMENIVEAISKASVIVSSTGAPGYVICSGQIARSLDRGSPLKLIVDLAVPRDVDTSGLPSTINVCDIGTLKGYADDQEKTRLESLPDAERIIDEEVSIFQSWSDSQSSELLAPYAERFEQIRLQLLEEHRSQFPTESAEHIDRLTRSLVHRLQSTFVRMLVKR